MDDNRLRETVERAQASGRVPAVVVGGLALVRQLGRRGIPIVLVTEDPDHPALRSRYVSAFRIARTDDFVSALTDVGRVLGRGLGVQPPLLFGQHRTPPLDGEQRRTLARHLRFALPDEGLAFSLGDRGCFYKLCLSTGLRTPATVAAGADLAAALARLTPPLVVRPRVPGTGARLARVLSDAGGPVFARAAEVPGASPHHPLHTGLVVQELVAAPPDAFFRLHAFVDDAGQVHGATCTAVQEQPLPGRPVLARTVAAVPEAEAAASAVIARLGLRGPVIVEAVRDPRSHQVLVLDVSIGLDGELATGPGASEPLATLVYEALLGGEGWRPSTEMGPTGHRPGRTIPWDDPLPFLSAVGRALAARVGGETRRPALFTALAPRPARR